MTMPQFTDSNQARKYIIDTLKNFLKRIEEAKSHKEKVKLIKEFDMSEFNAEDQILNGKQVKDYVEYQKAKSLVLDFFQWVEQNNGINVFNVSTSDNFFNEMHGEKTLIIAQLIQILPSLPVQLQAYVMLNIFRTTYELNFKNVSLIFHEQLKKQNKNTNKYYDKEDIRTEFNSYPKINDLMDYFKNDIRNPVAHEDWFVKNGWVWTKNKNSVKKQDMIEVSKQIYDLFYFRVALTTYLLEKYEDFAKNKDITPEILSKFINGIKLRLKELENG